MDDHWVWIGIGGRLVASVAVGSAKQQSGARHLDVNHVPFDSGFGPGSANSRSFSVCSV